MQIDFVKKLLSNGIIRPGTELSGSCLRSDLSGKTWFAADTVFRFHSSTEDTSGTILFNVIDTDNGSCHKLSIENIVAIDGMTAERIGTVYSIKSDGTAKPEPMRRGRKPKAKLADSIVISHVR